ncbi:hypothetical protein C0J52_22802 [Blattella germanica]|nr:hypothetical protein C0J52_22802 [Blattella germanica]
MRMSCSRSSFTSLLVLGNARSALAPKYKTGAVGVREDHYLSRHCGGIESSDSEQHLCVFVRACTIVPRRSVGYTTKQAIWNNNASENNSHEAKCSHGSYKCPFAMISNLDCDWYGSLTMMKDHIEQCHGDKRIQYVSKKFKTVLHNVEKSQRFYQAIITLGEVFYVKWRLYKGSFHCAVFYVGPHERASEFKYRFAISTNDGETVSGCSRTHSFLENVESIFRNGKCIMISQAILQRSYTDNGHLPIRMEISKVVNNNIANSNVNMNKSAMI